MPGSTVLELYDGEPTRANGEADLRQELPPPFARVLSGFLDEDQETRATLFVDRDEILKERTPARALVLSRQGVLFLEEEGEAVIGLGRWGVKALFYPYARISAVGMDAALLAGRFTLHGTGNAPSCEIDVPAANRPSFEVATRQIAREIAAA